MTKVTTVTVPLEYPLTEVRGAPLPDPIHQLTFRRMKAGDALVADDEQSKARAGYQIFAAMAGVDVSIIEELDLEDFENMSEMVAPLMGKSGAALLKKAAAAGET